MNISKDHSISLLQNRFCASDFYKAIKIYQLGFELGFDQLSDDDYYFLMSVLSDMRFGLDSLITSLKVL